MKTVFFASAAVAALIAAPAVAQETVGSAGVAYNYADAKGIESHGATIDGIVATPIFGDWTVTMKAAGSYADTDIIGDDTALSGQVFLTKKLDTVRVGGFVGSSDAFGATQTEIGAVAQKYFNQVTLTGALSYANINNVIEGADADIINVQAEAAYYATPALRLAAGVAYSEGDILDIDGETFAAKVGAEYQFASSPYSVFASYTYTDADYSVETDGFNIGVRYNFGGGLQARDQAGAGFGL